MARKSKTPAKEPVKDQRALRFYDLLEALRTREMHAIKINIDGLLNISPPEFRSLIWLARNGKSVMSDFALGIDVPLSTATRIVNRLVKKGIAARHRSELDRRIVEVDLSPDAREHAERFRAQRLTILQEILSPLHAPERDAILDLLEKGPPPLRPLHGRSSGQRSI